MRSTGYLALGVGPLLAAAIAGGCVGDDPATSPSPDGSDGGIDGPIDSSTGSDGPTGVPSLSLSPLTFRFPVTKPTASSAPAQFTVTNTGGGIAPPLQRAGLQGANTTPFEVTKDECDGKALTGGASCVVEITFKPAAVGEAAATLLVGTLPATLSGFGGDWLHEDAKGASLNAVWGAPAVADAGTGVALFAVGKSGRVLTSNGSGTWTEETGTAGSDLYAVHGTRRDVNDPSAGYVFAAGAGPRIVRKSPGAATWQSVAIIDPPMFLTNARSIVASRDENQLPFEVYVFGDGTRYYEFPGNSGSTTPAGAPAGPALQNIYATSRFVPAQDENICAVGMGGWVHGINLALSAGSAKSIDATATLRGVWATSGAPTRVFIVGDSGKIYSGNGCNSGTTFNSVPSNVSVQLNAVWVEGPDVYVVGNGGTILHAQGAGGFVKEESGTTKDLRGVFGLSAGDIYAVGDGIIVHKK